MKIKCTNCGCFAHMAEYCPYAKKEKASQAMTRDTEDELLRVIGKIKACIVAKVAPIEAIHVLKDLKDLELAHTKLQEMADKRILEDVVGISQSKCVAGECQAAKNNESNPDYMTYFGKPVDESMPKDDLIDIIKFLGVELSREKNRFNLRATV